MTDGTEPDARPDNVGASRDQGDPGRDADSAAGGPRTGASTEYAANAGNTPAEDADGEEPGEH